MFESLFSPIPFLISKWHNLTYTIPTVEKFQDAITFFNYFELSIMPISLIIFIYFIFVLNSISLFHRNISILLHYSLFWIVVGFISRFYILFVRIRIVGIDEDLLFVASFLRLQCYGNILTVQSMVVVERFFATYYVSDYEKNHRVWINLIVLPMCFLLSQSYSLLLFFYRPPLIFPTAFCIFMTVISFTLLNILMISNSRKLVRLKLNPILYTLSEKFQIEENLRVMWYLRAILCFMICLCGFLSIFLIFPPILGFQEISIQSVLKFLDLGVALACLLMPIGMFCALYHLRHPAFLRKIRFGNKVRSRSSIRTINETDVYFGNLKKSWL